MNTTLVKGFSQPVHDAQVVFRQVLNAMSEPGLWQNLPKDVVFSNLYSSTTALLLALLDADTPLWLTEKCRTADIKDNLTFHCGCPLVCEQEKAHFAVLDCDDFLNMQSMNFIKGSDRYPDQSTTIILQLPQSGIQNSTIWQGPGIEQTRECILPIPNAFWAKRNDLIEFPRGIDFILTYQDSVMGLPRTTQVSEQKDALCM